MKMNVLTKLRFIPVLLFVILLVSCGPDTSQSSGTNQGNYKDTKTMVMDILKSEEGKKAIKEASKGGGNSGSGSGGGAMSMISESQLAQLKIAAKDVLTSTDNSKLLQEIMKDPQFAGEFAKAIKNDNKQLQKDLMKDPEYQKQMLEIMKNSDYEKMVLEVMKSVPYRQQVMNLIQESMQSPLFKTQLISLMKKAVEQQEQPMQQKTEGGKEKEGKGGEGKDQGKKKDKEQSSGKEEGKDSSGDSDSESDTDSNKKKKKKDDENQ